MCHRGVVSIWYRDSDREAGEVVNCCQYILVAVLVNREGSHDIETDCVEGCLGQ